MQCQTVRFLSNAWKYWVVLLIYSYNYVGEFQTEGALTLKAFADNASTILGTVSNSLSDDRSVRAGR